MDEPQLHEKIKCMQNELEGKNQQIHDFKRQLSTAQALEQDYLLEIEGLQLGESNELKRLNARIQQLEEQLADVNEHVQHVEVELMRKDTCIKELHAEVKVTEQGADTAGKEAKEHEVFVEENERLKRENLVLSEALLERQLLLEKLQTQNVQLEEVVSNINAELNQTKEMLSGTRDELREANKLIQMQQEEMVVLKSELDSLKVKPLDGDVKGNSLFAEVNDSRLQIQKNMRQMKKKYVEIKQEITVKLKTIAELREQNNRLAQQLKEETDLRDAEIESRMEIYTHHISDLERLLNDFKKDATEKQLLTSKELPTNTMEFINKMLEKKESEIGKLRDDLRMQSRANMMLSLELKGANLELCKSRVLVEQLRLQVGQLQDELVAINLDAMPKTDDDVDHGHFRLSANVSTRKTSSETRTSTKSILKMKNDDDAHTIDLTEDRENERVGEMSGKENVGRNVERKVMFTGDTNNAEDGNRTRLRRGGKIIESKAIRISTNSNINI